MNYTTRRAPWLALCSNFSVRASSPCLKKNSPDFDISFEVRAPGAMYTTANFLVHVHVLVTGICPLHNCAKPIPRPPLRPKPVLQPGRSAPLCLRLLPLKHYFSIWKTPFQPSAVVTTTDRHRAERRYGHCRTAYLRMTEAIFSAQT